MANKKVFKPEYVKNILIDHATCSKGVVKAANWLDKKFANAKHPPIFVCLLRGAVPFYTKLIMNLHIDIVTDYMIVSSFQGTMTRQSKPKIITNLQSDVKGRDIVVCDDVADSARTLKLLKQYLKDKGAKSVTFVVFADKPAGRKVNFKPDYACFSIKGKPFLVGYGLDIYEIGRNIPYLAEMDQECLKKVKL